MKFLILLIPIFLTSFVNAQSAAHACRSTKINNFNLLSQKSALGITSLDYYDEKFVKLDLEISNTSTDIEGICTHIVKVNIDNLSNFKFQLTDFLDVTEIKVNNSVATFSHSGNLITVNSPFTHSEDELVEIEIAYNGTPPFGSGFNSASGVFNDFSPSWGVQVTWTLSEPYVAYTWWPCKQDIMDKIDSTELIFTTDTTLKVGSNGLLVSEEDLNDGKVKYTWKSNYPIDYYLISYAVAPYQDYSYKVLPNGASDSLLIQNYIYKTEGFLSTYENDILETGDMLIDLSDKFGLYPFINEKYGHCLAPLGGGMEHQTMTTQGYFFNTLTVHELGHQWWGDNVTCSSWNDIWLNEGFASYSEYIYFQSFHDQIDADQDMEDRHNTIMSQNGGSVYVYDASDPNNLFDSRLVYDKGAAVVHMIRNCINDDDLFYETLQEYQNQFRGGNASTSDLNDVLLISTNIDFSDFFDAWVYGEGYPTYSGEYNTLNDTIYLALNQSASTGDNSIVYPSCLEIVFIFDDATEESFVLDDNKKNGKYYFPINKIIDSIVIDPKNWIINKVGDFNYNQNLYFTPEELAISINQLDNNLIFAENPFKNNLKINLENLRKVEKIEIVDITGKIVYSQTEIIENQLLIKTNSWKKGFYFINITANSKQYSQKILKN